MSPAEHALCGALAGTLAACAAPGPLRGRGRWVLWTAAGALAPDLDAASLLFSHAIYFGGAWYSHRQFLHSILGCAFLALLLPALATLGTLQFLNYWNEFLYPLVVTTSNEMRTLPVGLATLQTPTGGLPELLAGATLGIAPTIVVFLLFQRFFVRGVVMSGLKG